MLLVILSSLGMTCCTELFDFSIMMLVSDRSLSMRCALQELFPESYAETAEWLRREVNAHGDSLLACEQQLQQALEQDPEFKSLAASCQVGCVITEHVVQSKMKALPFMTISLMPSHWLTA